MLQKGLASDPGGHWKLQIDGKQSRPSCVVASGPRREGRAVVKASQSVADGRWHDVACRRTAGSLDVLVDGRVAGAVPATPVALEGTAPVRVGGKSAERDNDQFHGALDEVFVRVGGSR